MGREGGEGDIISNDYTIEFHYLLLTNYDKNKLVALKEGPRPSNRYSCNGALFV